MALYGGLNERPNEAAVPRFTKSCSVDYISRELVSMPKASLRKRAAFAVLTVGAVVAVCGSIGHVGRRPTTKVSTSSRTVLDEEHAGGSAAAGHVHIKLDAAAEAEPMIGVNLPGNDLEVHQDIIDEKKCAEMCKQHDECVAWSWGKWNGLMYEGNCFLKGTKPRILTKVLSVGFISGVVAREGEEELHLKKREAGQSLFCYSLVQAEGYEAGLLTMQYDEAASVFMCDEYALYSNMKIDIKQGIVVSIVNSTLKCDIGGEFRTALNTGIFLAVWSKVVQDGRFIDHDWTVKVDPDAVFFPGRLREHLMNHLEEEGGVYINNCKYGLHGPLEVLSRNAVKAWALGAGDCVKYFTKLCNGFCGWGEDMFIDQCMDKRLKIRRDNDYELVLEDHCDPPDNWDDCTEEGAVAFHPFKTKAGWLGCFHKLGKDQGGGFLK